MKYNLYLDDLREPVQSFHITLHKAYLSLDWLVVRNYEEFQNAILTHGIPDVLSLDHDLADEHYDPDLYGSETYNELYDKFEFKTGYDCAKWLIEHCIDTSQKLPRSIMIHTQNCDGGANMKSLFETYYKVNKITDREKINDVRYIHRGFQYIYSGYEGE